MSRSESYAINKKVSRLLAKVRKDRHLTQMAVAARLKKTQSFVSKYESGGRKLSTADLISVCKAIGIKPAEFFKMYEKET